VNALSAATFFKVLTEESGMDEVIGALGQVLEWEYPEPRKAAWKELDGTEMKIKQNLGHRWSQVLKLTKSNNQGSKRRALILLYAYLLRITISSPSIHDGKLIY
jgi:translocation protein SEC63